MRIAVAATPSLAIPSLEALYHKHDIAFVITQPDRPTGRGRNVQQSDVAAWAITKGLPVYKNLSECTLLSEVDCVITIAFGVIIPKEILARPRFGFLNLHYSLLPRWRGAAPVQRALMAGDKKTGVTVFQLEAGMDTGPIFVSREMIIEENWNAEDLFTRLNEIGSQALLDAIDLVESGFQPKAQNGQPTLAPKIAKEEFLLNFALPSQRLRAVIRGLYPSSYTFFDGKRVKVLAAENGPAVHGRAGEVMGADPLIVACGDGSSLILQRVIPEGKREMATQDWVRGTRIEPGAFFG